MAARGQSATHWRTAETKKAAAQAVRPGTDGEVTLLHNIALLGMVGRLSAKLMVDGPSRRSTTVAHAIKVELLRGGWGGRRRFAKRVMRRLAWHLLRRRVFANLPPPVEPAWSDSPNLPQQYGRLSGGLSSWRTLSPAAAQWLPPREDERQADLVRAQAQEIWARLAATRPDLPYLRSLYPHEGAGGNLRVLVLLGGGGLGDALLFSAVLAELHTRLTSCEIVLLFEKGVVEALYEGSAHVACAVSAPWGMLQDTALAMRWAGIFDLVVDIFCFLPRYLVCERSRIDMDRHGLWLDGNSQLGDIIDRFSSNLGMALLDRALGMHVLDLLGSTAGLPLHAGSPLIFSPAPEALATVRTLSLPQDYVTIRDGANPGDRAMARELGATHTTKQLPQPKWTEICAEIRSHGLAIVQVGDMGDTKVVEADLDLRGRTTLSELCFIMKGAVTHVDTEGGLAHLARASNVPSIVFFGPTSARFFGYPTNLNLTSARCAHCWYSTASWVARCPVQPDGKSCGMDIDLTPMRTRLMELRQARPFCGFGLAEVALAGEGPGSGQLPFYLRDWALAEARRNLDRFFHVAHDARIGFVTQQDNAPTSRDIVKIVLLDMDLQPDVSAPAVAGSIHNMPVNDGSYDVLLCDDVLAGVRERPWAVRELARLLRPEGLLLIATSIAGSATPGFLDIGGLAECVRDATGLNLVGLDAERIARGVAALKDRAEHTGTAWALIILRRQALGPCSGNADPDCAWPGGPSHPLDGREADQPSLRDPGLAQRAEPGAQNPASVSHCAQDSACRTA